MLLLQHPPHHPVSWWRDDFLPWLVALSTFVGVVAAILAGIFAALAYRREVLRDRARDHELDLLREKERRATASQVTVWLSHQSGFDRQRDPKGERLPSVLIRNGSGLPAYNARVRWFAASSPLDPLIPRGDPVAVAIVSLGTIAPSDEVQSFPAAQFAFESLLTFQRQAERQTPASEHGVHLSVALHFADPAGNHWTRHDNGLLEEDGRH